MYGGGGNWGASAYGLRLKGTLYRLKVQLHARGRTHLGHLVHPKAIDLQMEYSDIPSANPSLYDPSKKKNPIVAARTRGWNRQKQQQKQRSSETRSGTPSQDKRQCRPRCRIFELCSDPGSSRASATHFRIGAK